MEQATLEKLRLGLQMTIANELLDARVDIDEHWLPAHVIFRIRGSIWSEQVDHFEFKCPCDWWQAFKERWFPKWALRKWPVKHRLETINIKVLYPDFRPSVPDERWQLRIIKA